jgi:hypothetical protein
MKAQTGNARQAKEFGPRTPVFCPVCRKRGRFLGHMSPDNPVTQYACICGVIFQYNRNSGEMTVRGEV